MNLRRPTPLLAMLTLGGFVLGSSAAIAVTTDTPPAPSETKAPPKGKQKSGDQKAKKKQSRSDQDFMRHYKLAYDLVHKGGYAEGIAILRALDEDDHADVANLVGFAYRKLGSYDDSKVWYERALASDPGHTRTWQYYGLWHLEQGNRLKAQDHLETIRLICGADCSDYQTLKSAIDSGKFSY